MPRKVTITANEVLAARGSSWEFHFQQRSKARTYPLDAPARVLRACSFLPEPRLNIFGWLDDWNYIAARKTPMGVTVAALMDANVPLEMLVKWYWSEPNWEELVTQFNNLSYPLPLYEIAWKDEYPQVLPLSISVAYKPVDNSSTNSVHSEYKWGTRARKGTLEDLNSND